VGRRPCSVAFTHPRPQPPRLLLDPLGLALEVTVAEDGTEFLGGVWDCREDPEGVLYDGDSPDVAKAQRVSEALLSRKDARVQAMGYLIQAAVWAKGGGWR
jgi:hypothetical protein